MRPGFLDKTLDTRSANGRDDVLLSDLRFLDVDGTLYRVPTSALTDGGSTPRLVWIIPGFEPIGEHWFNWVLHDGGYRGTLEVFRDDEWVKADLSQLQCDQLLDRSLTIHNPMTRTGRFFVYRTLRTVGWRSYRSKA